MRTLLPCLLLISACSFPNTRFDLRVHEAVPTGGEGFSLALYQSVGVAMKPGNQTELVVNGRIFDALEEEILQAKSSIHIVTFIWRKSAPSDRILKAIETRMAERKGQITCRIMVDPIGSVGFDSAVRLALSNAGCDVRYFRPAEFSHPLKLTLRNHRKILVVDGRVAITGGFGIWSSWLGEGMTEKEWRDTNVRVRGPAVRDLQLAFAGNWQEAGGALMPADCFPELPAVGDERAAFVASTGNPTLSHAERMLQLVIASAKQRVWIANSYFIPSTAIGDMLLQKVKEGVEVRVLASGRVHDWRMVRAAQRSTYDRLLEGGVQIWEYQPSMMHSKTLLVDDRIVVIGSINLDPLSLKKMEEGALVVESPALAAAMEKSWSEDLKHSISIRPDNYMHRDLVDRMARKLTALIGVFL